MHESERYFRDLVWAVNSPRLMARTNEARAATPPLNVRDIDRGHLSDYLRKHGEQAVGRYFERLIVYWIRFVRRCEIVAQTLQLREGDRTVGEIDLMFRDEQGCLNHWELACKFYLQVEVGPNPTTDYVGPNANDTLRKKATRLQEHQLPLSARFFPDVEIREAFVKGRIFYHWQTGTKEAAQADLAAGHLEGRWMRAREVPELFHAPCLRYRILRKPFWLADEVAEPSDDDLMTTDQAIEVLGKHFRNRQSPVLVSGFLEGTSGLREAERWFVVPNQWPSQT